MDLENWKEEFAETAMNELLGWYGYDGVDRLDLSSKTSRLLKSAASANHNMEKDRSRSRNGLSDSRQSHRGGDSTTSDHDTHSSREDSKSPNSSKAIDDKPDYNNCVWCRRPVPDNSTDFLTTADGPRYCSESCFTQSRRASFKKAKTCDWCRHVRHAVSYVDFQDGASQLQFCSDKCLNQYKMQIFCKETQAHLDMNPHLCDKGLETASGSGGLITPDLWLRNCRSRSASPASTVSVSPSPATPTPQLIPTQPHKPLISVAPVSKLMSKSPGIMNNRQSPKHSRKKRPSRAATASIGLQSSNNSKTTNSINNNNNTNISNKSKILANSLAASPKLPPKPFPSVQDFQNISAPPISPIDGPTQQSQQHPAARPTNLPSGFFPGPSFQPRPPFMPQPHPRFYGGLQHLFPPPDAISGLLGGPPPVTVMVPYPIIIPLPIPIPIPLPIMDFVKAAQKKEQAAMPPEIPTTSNAKPSELNEEPLDFTKSKEEEPTLVENPPEAESLPSPVSKEQPIINPEEHSDDNFKEEKLPKLKITRLHSKRLVTASSHSPSFTSATTTTPATATPKEAQTSPSECSRPLRKRKRIIDCDFQRMTSKEVDVEDITSSGNKQRK
ncbi:sine oculis-binding protein homolog A isoform X2 [Episyrphus balteatus]|uniref:sine oculis-binding protein homolog A isoform X2 n=1 Tax=Episyrphus balteatus TaxID=286459 RepID=UPI002485CD78|nr:sine oculis-binding protein homolog A isoform X2 [Episyrphus balteatus]XP_055853994.1 sine oculis-binding protein homolog A isoform X2 [Episyrphus balteatus]